MASAAVARRRLPRAAHWLIWAGAAVLTIEVLLSAGLYWAMSQPPDSFGRIVAHTPLPFMMVLPFETLWKRARSGRLNPGEIAPDFRLPTLDHQGAVQLSSVFASRPVVLVFGSYT